MTESMQMPFHWHHSQHVATVAAAWTAMMAVMMAPTVAPWIGAYHRVLASHRPTSVRALGSAQFAAGYLGVWALFGIVAAVAQLAVTAPAEYAGILLVGAGLFQLSPMKRACLAHCRNPLTFLLARWQDGPASGLRLGWVHGLYCVGCCWALMLTALAIGVMNLAWMAVLTVTTFVEQVLPWGGRVRVPVGIALITAGLWWGVAA